MSIVIHNEQLVDILTITLFTAQKNGDIHFLLNQLYWVSAHPNVIVFFLHQLYFLADNRA